MSKEKEIKVFDYERDKIQCNLCHKFMTMEKYERHYDKCLLIKALIPILKSKGEDVSYETLNEYDYKTLDKVWDKYNPPKQIGSDKNGRSD